MNIFIDSSVYVSAFQENEPQHKCSLEFLEKVYHDENIRVVVSPLVVIEVLNVLARKNNKKPALKRVQNSIFNPDGVSICEISEDLIDSFFSAALKISLKTADLMIILSASSEADVLIGWDKKMIKEGKKIMNCLTPEEYLK
jgi:predicted nucleic acid-binding protein